MKLITNLLLFVFSFQATAGNLSSYQVALTDKVQDENMLMIEQYINNLEPDSKFAKKWKRKVDRQFKKVSNRADKIMKTAKINSKLYKMKLVKDELYALIDDLDDKYAGNSRAAAKELKDSYASFVEQAKDVKGDISLVRAEDRREWVNTLLILLILPSLISIPVFILAGPVAGSITLGGVLLLEMMIIKMNLGF